MRPGGGLAPGDVVGDYRIEQRLGRGGMGMVYLARQESLGRRVALKLILPELAGDATFRARFEREWRTAAAIEHSHVVPIYGAGEVDGLLFLAMRYVPGRDLGTLLAQEGPLRPQRAGRLLAQVADALDAAHAGGLVHRDVKPGNVLVAGEPPQEIAYLSDFGLTKELRSTSELSRTGEWMGTPDYLAPEQIRGAALDARADVYALGCVLYRMVTGRVPFERDSDVGKLWAHVNEAPPSAAALNPSLPREVDGVLGRALAKDPDDRFKSAGDLARAAVAAIEGRSTVVAERSVATGGAAPARDSRAATAFDEGATPALPPEPRTPPTAAVAGGVRARSGSKLTAIAIVVAALVLTVGGVGAALILSGGSSDGGGGTSPTPTEPTNPTPTTEPGPSPDTRAYSTPTYTAELPTGWTMIRDYQDQGQGRYRTELTKGGRDLVIDTTPGVSSGDLRANTEKLDANSRSRSDYNLIELSDTAVRGEPAFRWVFDSGNLRKIDIFFFEGGHGYAVLAAGPPGDFAATRELAERVAASVRSS